MTPIDTVYEYAGYKLAGILYDLLGGAGLPLIVGLAGAAYVVHAMADRGSPKDLGVHLLYLVLMAWLLSPIEVQGMRAPRFVAWLGQAVDHLQKRTLERVNESFLKAPFEWERVAAMASFAQVLDPALGKDVDAFLEECAKPALARAAPRGPNVFRDGALAYDAACEKRRKGTWKRIRDHVATNPAHKAAIEAARRHTPEGASEFRERYLDQVAVKALDEGGSPTGEMALIHASLGEYSHFDSAQSTGGVPWYAKAYMTSVTPWMAPVYYLLGDKIADGVVSGAAKLHQAWGNRFTAKQHYYLVTVYGPHVYGLSLLFVIGIFPLAGLFALLPGKWRALVNYGKVLVSVKLWPVFWAALSSFNARRSALEAFDPSPRESSDVFLAAASMYLLTPAIAYLVVNLAVSAASMPFGQAVPPPSGPGLGPVMPAVRAAGMAARLG